MPISHIAIVGFDGLRPADLNRVSAALQKQMIRDVAPVWGVSATVDPFSRLDEVPLGYWPIIITTESLEGEEGVHLDQNGEPYALIESSPSWSLTASHECIEMLVDPFGKKLVEGSSPIDQGRVQFLVEACDPCQSPELAYTVDDILVSDFCTPDFFYTDASSGAVFNYSGAIKKARDVAPGGCLSWLEPSTRHWWQRQMEGTVTKDVDLGLIDVAACAREAINRRSPSSHSLTRLTAHEVSNRLGGRAVASKRASRARAQDLHAHIRARIASAKAREPALTAKPLNASLIGLNRQPRVPIDDAALRTKIDKALAAIEATADLKNQEEPKNTLIRARAQLDKNGSSSVLTSSLSMRDDDEIHLQRVRSAAMVPEDARFPLFARDIFDFGKYKDLDLGWLLPVVNEATRDKEPFGICPAATPPRVEQVFQMAKTAVIAMAGDWGTGNASSRQIAQLIDGQRPTHTIHLGDVYYSGTEGEEQENFVSLWPTGSVASFALNSNHEMYSGGRGYFGVALLSEKFETQGPYSYFALTNDDWIIVGLDSAYGATHFYQLGGLNQPQKEWLGRLVASPAMKRADGRRKNVIVLTHHQGLELSGTRVAPLWDDVVAALGGVCPDFWYWGHVHGVAAFAPMQVGGVTLNARLLGHGGVPYISDPGTPALLWSEPDRVPNDPGRSLNGFAILRFHDQGLTEELWDEIGRLRWSASTLP